MFKFLKLRKSDSGDARRHVPFTSIIHKHVLPLLLSLILVLFSSVKNVYAVDIPLPPVWLPMNPYNSDALHNNYVLLNDDQKKIVHEIMGAYGSVFLGLAANPLQNPIDTVLKARSWLQEYGSTFLNTIFDSTVQAPRAMQDLVGSVTYKASTYSSYDDYVNDTNPEVSSGLEKYMQFTPELTVAYKNWFAVNGSVYDWQMHSSPWPSSFTWNEVELGSAAIEYNSYIAQLPDYIVKANQNDYYNTQVSIPHQYNLFFDTTNNYVYLANDSGGRIDTIGGRSYIYIWRYANVNYPARNLNDLYIACSRLSISAVSGVTYKDKTVNIFNNFTQIMHTGSFSFDPTDVINHVYVGADWTNKEELYNIDDLNIAASPSAYIDNVGNDAFVNINGLIGYLGSDVTDVREGVFENTLVRDGDHAVELTDSILNAIDRAVEETKSGIVIPTDVFSSLFDGGKGFISYMWYMTKPLVVYTRDLLDLLTFDPVDGFNASGPGYFILGVVGLGVIGGVIVKFLL